MTGVCVTVLVSICVCWVLGNGLEGKEWGNRGWIRVVLFRYLLQFLFFLLRLLLLLVYSLLSCSFHHCFPQLTWLLCFKGPSFVLRLLLPSVQPQLIFRDRHFRRLRSLIFKITKKKNSVIITMNW